MDYNQERDIVEQKLRATVKEMNACIPNCKAPEHTSVLRKWIVEYSEKLKKIDSLNREYLTIVQNSEITEEVMDRQVANLILRLKTLVSTVDTDIEATRVFTGKHTMEKKQSDLRPWYEKLVGFFTRN